MTDKDSRARNGLFLHGDNGSLQRAEAVLKELKVISQSRSRVQAICKLNPLLFLIANYFEVDDAHQSMYLKALRSHSEELLKQLDARLSAKIH